MKRLLLVLCLLGCGTQDALIEKQKEELKNRPLVPVPDNTVPAPTPKPTPIGSPAPEVIPAGEPIASSDGLDPPGLGGEKQAADVTLLFFTAPWCKYCGPTKAAAKEACEVTGAKYVEVDLDKYREYARRWGVVGIPAIITLHGGVERWRREGMTTASAIVSAILSSRQKYNWSLRDLKAEIQKHSRSRSLQNRWRVESMSPYEHLVRDHLWPGDLVRDLTREEQLWLHDATHEGAILP